MGRAAMSLAIVSLATSCERAPECDGATVRAPAIVADLEPGASGFAALRGQTERLRFSVGDLRTGSPPRLTADCAPLREGGLLVRFSASDEDGFFGASCYLDLAPEAYSRAPRAAGVLEWGCLGVRWIPDLVGTVEVDATNPDELLCRVDLDGAGRLLRRRTFRTLPGQPSEGVRAELEKWSSLVDDR